jgi:GH15 family glucan-1,4-alpha-glucosidase
MNEHYRNISSYGVIGNLETCALVGRDGAVDWLCLPYLESPSVFGALLDRERGGTFRICPAMRYESSHSYLGTTNILQTTFITPTGNALLTDFMPVKSVGGSEAGRMLIRKVEGTKGVTWLRVALQPRFNYGRVRPVFSIVENGVVAKGGRESLFLRSPGGFSWELNNDTAEGTLTVKGGEKFWFVLCYDHAAAADEHACGTHLRDVREYWENWVNNYLQLRGLFDDPWRDVIIRSGLALKLLINPDSGAIAASATTSLPEQGGGIRNWDYRFAWLRDSSFTIQALYHLGDVNELRGYNHWIEQIVRKAKDMSGLRALYALRSEADIRESILDNFSGYGDAGPVRIGNAAVEQRQLDIYGELVNGLYETSRYGTDVTADLWEIIREMVNYVCKSWKEPDNGIWEFRGSARHFVYSKLMCWVAVDRALRIARKRHYDAPLMHWRKTQKDIFEAILHNGYDARRNTFVQSFGSPALDAAALLIPIMGFLPFHDRRIQGTIKAIQSNLVVNRSLVYRYHNDDGLAGGEGCFTICSFWLIKALALSGKKREAEELFENTLQYMSPLGLLSEEIDPATGRQLGNFPQAFSHIGLINASLYIGIAKGKEHAGPAPSGIGSSPVQQVTAER